MYLERVKSKQGGKVYEQVLLRESYRESGGGRSAVKKRTLANLTKQPPEVIAAIELALRHKDDLSVLGTFEDVGLSQGKSVGAIYVLNRLAVRLGLDKVLGPSREGKLALWQVLARAIDQGSRLSAVRLAKFHEVGGILGLERGFDEDDLYENLDWLAARQKAIEDRLFQDRWGERSPGLFLYDVTSSYLEGWENELADFGYNRDKKRGKKQLVIGLLCDRDGEPVATEVFPGNTSDLDTFEAQVAKAVERFGCERVTFVGDRGMIKGGQVKDLKTAGFHYITAITKRQIRSLLNKGVFQMSLFDERVCEVGYEGLRYVLRRNPTRAEEMAESRADKLAEVRKLAEDRNEYLAVHKRAKVFTALEKVRSNIGKLKIEGWLKVKAEDRRLLLEVDEEALAEASLLDGCYVLRTDLPKEAADARIIHDRYKDLAMVEIAFRTMKTVLLEIRPVYVRTEAHTRAHVLVVMLAYKLVRELRKAWAGLNLTVAEGLDLLKRVCAVEMKLKTGAAIYRVPTPDETTGKLIEALGLSLPSVLPKATLSVASRKNLAKRRNLK